MPHRGYIAGMKAIPNLYFINEIFEVQISQTEWQKICAISQKFEYTFTATTRLCVFQLMRRGLNRTEVFEYKRYLKRKYLGWLEVGPEQGMLMTLGERQVWQRPSSRCEPLHRHMLCLYGNDAMQLRVMAAHYGLSISDFVRIALELFLPSLENDLVSGRVNIVRHGIKVYEICEIAPVKSYDKDFHNQTIKLSRYKPDSYWGWRPFPFFGSG